MNRLLFLVLLIAFTVFVISCGEDFSDEPAPSSGVENETPPEVITGDQYVDYGENEFVSVADQPVSTFSIDADGASYANVRRFILNDKMMPPAAAVRAEEFINYFDLDYPFEDEGHPISLNGEVSRCPWNIGHKLIRIGIKGKPIGNIQPASNYVFLIDVSGSMGAEDKITLLIAGLNRMVDQLTADDRVAIVTYAGNAGVVLESTPGSEKETIREGLENMGVIGGTNGAEGILTAYDIAEANFIEGGNNRIIVGTDGDFNIGPRTKDEIIQLIRAERDKGIFLTVLGLGRGNLNEPVLEQMANNGNGNYEYIDNISQIRKVFEFDYSKFFTVAKDVKVQVTFNPDQVQGYRLIGYENRVLDQQDFDNDSTDAGELGANQNVTALYEIRPVDQPADLRADPSFTINFRYKKPTSDISTPVDLRVFDLDNTFDESSDFMKFTASVASYSMLLRNSPYIQNSDYDRVLDWLNDTNLKDPHGFKAQFKEIVTITRDLAIE